jgi:peptidoglycan/xylan/chitin deacetylase (PgdA/CDA1 family)
MMKLYLSIDLESWAYPDHPAFTGLSASDRKELDAGFVSESIDKILDLLDSYRQKITFFTLGELFQWYPQSLKKIKQAGHEIAYHGHKHKRISDSAVLCQEMANSKDFLSEFKPIGFRAPEIFLPAQALKPLKEAGFCYSSSVYAGQTDTIKLTQDGFCEFPVSTFKYCPRKSEALDYPRSLTMGMLSREMPFGSGYFFALLGISSIERMIRKYSQAGRPAVIFVHNWQVVRPKQATFPDLKYKLTHPAYLPYTWPIERKLKYFLNRYSLGKMEELVWDQKNIGIKK